MKARVNKDVCIGCGACTTIVKDYFVFGEDGLAEVTEEKREENVPEELEDDVIVASDSCPTCAIEVEE